jgi:FMN phosphatase YigB (HAD superfamily)/DNA-binding Xre family transcriptional regulator
MSLLDEKALGKRLQHVRKQKGFTQQALCQAANLSYSTLAKIERGAIKAPSIFTVQNIAEALQISLDELLGVQTGTAPARAYQKSQGGVSFVYFDVNDTLVRAAQRGFSILAEQTGTLPDVIERIFWHYNDELCRGTMGTEDFNQLLSKRLGAPVNWRQAYLDGAEPIEAVQELLRWASERYRVGLLSNGLPGLLSGLREQQLLPDVPYAAIIDSSEVGLTKPDPKIFDLAQQRAEVPANEILLIDDNRSNLIVAEQHGWHVAMFDGYRADDSAARIRATLEPAS